MRFSLFYYHVPEWSEFYIQYDLIKSRLKLGVTKPSTLHPIESEPYLQPLNFLALLPQKYTELLLGTVQLFEDAINIFDAFHTSQLTNIQHRKTALWELFHEPRPIGRGLHSCEREFLIAELNRRLEQLPKLRWFDRVNQEAINRLFDKFQRLAPQFSHLLKPLRSHWDQLEKAQQLSLSDFERKTQANILGVEKAIDGKGGMNSLLLNAVLGELPDHALLRAAVLKPLDENESDTSTRLVNRLATLPQVSLPGKLRSLFNFWVIQRSWENVLSLLGHSIFEGSLELGYDDVQLLINVYSQELNSPKANTDTTTTTTTGSQLHIADDPSSLTIFTRILQFLGPAAAKDLFIGGPNDQLILHLLAKYGLLEWCRVALTMLRETGEESNVAAAILSVDKLELTPMHYALIYHHALVMDFFVDILGESGEGIATPQYQALVTSCLILAVRLGYDDVVVKLLRITTNVNLKSSYGSTALHIAARKGKSGAATLLLYAGASVNVTETSRGWTPLFEAAAEGHIQIVRQLIEYGADATVTDHLGWTAKEVATYRGHLAAAELLHGFTVEACTASIKGIPRVRTSHMHGCETGPENIAIIVNLGPMQVGRNAPAVQLLPFPANPVAGNKSLFSLDISLGGQTRCIRLPILEERTNAPLVFSCPHGTDLRLVFRVFHDDPTEQQRDRRVLISGGTALLESNKLLFGAQRQSLVREHTVTILSSTTLDTAGSILFTYVVAKPFGALRSPKYSLTDTNTDESRVILVGHRGVQCDSPLSLPSSLVDHRKASDKTLLVESIFKLERTRLRFGPL
jgi:glycerophosphodiester phosphodiesterase